MSEMFRVVPMVGFGRRVVRVALAGAAVVVMAACSGESLLAPSEAALAKGVSAPGTPVGAAFTITTQGTTVVSFLDEPKNGGNHANDYCANGAYMKYKSNTGTWEINGSNPHAQCTETVVVEGSTITVTFAAIANYVLSSNGNIQLNFQDLPVINESSLACMYNCTPRNIHFKKTGNNREGTGLVVGEGSDGSLWTIDMSQFAGLNVGPGGLAPAIRSFTGTATEIGGPRTGTTTFSW